MTTLTHATIIGRTHRLMQQNRQDAAFVGDPADGVSYGLVLDGCGSKVRNGRSTAPSANEVGAHLLGSFAAQWLDIHLADNPADLTHLLDELSAACAQFLRDLTALMPNPKAKRPFIATHLLTTLVGFVVTPETAVCFWRGDGYLCLNGQVVDLDAHNRPDYLAYTALTGPQQPTRFCQLSVAQRSDLQWLAVATDGWSAENLTAVSKPQSSLQLQRWLNQQARQRGHFDDDGAIAVYYTQIGSRTEDRGLRTEDQGQRKKDKGPRTKDKNYQV